TGPEVDLLVGPTSNDQYACQRTNCPARASLRDVKTGAKGMRKILSLRSGAGVRLMLLIVTYLLLAWPNRVFAEHAFLQISNGYFWDPTAADYFVPRGIAYQIWNPPVGANQSTNQVNYDFVEFKKIYANSVRAELTWGQVETGLNQYDWTRPDYLVKRA